MRAGDDKKPWPEFAESDCFSCHANLRPESTDWRLRRPEYRGDDPSTRRKPGSLPYNVWFSTGLPELAKTMDADAVQLRKDFADLGRLMSKPYPVRKDVVSRVDSTLDGLKSLGDKVNTLDPEKVRKAASPPWTTKKLAALSWDEATQLVYGLAALNAASGGSDKKVTDQLAKIYPLLAYPKGFEGSRRFSPGHGSSSRRS